MSLDHNRIKVADLEKNLPNKILITNIEGELAFSDLDSLELDFQQVTDNGYITENPFYRYYDYGEGRAHLGVVDTPDSGLPGEGLPIVGVRSAGELGENLDNFVLGFGGENGYGELPNIVYRTEGYGSPSVNRNLRFELPLKDNPSYPQYDKYTLATTDDLAGLTGEFVHRTGEVDEAIDGNKVFQDSVIFRKQDSEQHIIINNSTILSYENGNQKAITISPAKIKYKRYGQGSILLTVTDDDIDENFTQILQAKEGTIALLSDITLQKVLDNGAYADLGGDNYARILEDNDGNFITDFSSTLAGGFNSRIHQDGGSLYLSVSKPEGSSSFMMTSSGLTTNTTFVLPTSKASGVYTLAATADLNNYLPLSGGTLTGDLVINTRLNNGLSNVVSGTYTHAEGRQTTASGNYSHAEGYLTFSSGQYSHAEGRGTQATTDYTHAEGRETTASASAAHAEGYQTTASGTYAHSEGRNNQAIGSHSHAEGRETVAGSITNEGAHAEGYLSQALGKYSHAEGKSTQAINTYSHAEGEGAIANGYGAHAEGYQTNANGQHSHAEGRGSSSNANYSHAEGYGTNASGVQSHAEGYYTTAQGDQSHAEGRNTMAAADGSHAEGYQTTAGGLYSHAEGVSTNAAGKYSHTEGDETIAYGEASKAIGHGTIARSDYQFALGKYNIDTIDALAVIGNGSASVRSNLAEFYTGSIVFNKNLIIGSSVNNGVDKLQLNGSAVASAWKVIGGSSNQFLKADGSLDSNVYATTAFVTAADNLKANIASPTFTGTVTLPSATSIGNVSSTELSYVDGVTSSIQTQLNSKQATLTNPVTGTGTANFLAKFTGTSALGNSLIFDNGTNIGIGTSSPFSKLSIYQNESPTLLTLKTGGDEVFLTFATSGSSDPVYGSVIINQGDDLLFTHGSAFVNSMRLKGNGNILMGSNTDINGTKLQVTGGITATGGLGFNAHGDTSRIGFNTGDSFSAFGADVPHYGMGYSTAGKVTLSGYNGIGLFTNGIERVHINSTGEGAGVKVNGFIDVSGNAIPSIPSSGVGTVLDAGYSHSRLMPYDNGTWNRNLTITPYGGNVLIGTESDNGAKFQVNGDARTNSLGINGSIQSGFVLDVNGSSVFRNSVVNLEPVSFEKETRIYDPIMQKSYNNGYKSWLTQRINNDIRLSPSISSNSEDWDSSKSFTFGADGVFTTSAFNAKSTEGLKLINDLGYISGYDSANTARSGYLQFSGGKVTLASEVGAKSIVLNPDGGNVLIGTDTDSGDKLRVNGSIFSDSVIYAAHVAGFSGSDLNDLFRVGFFFGHSLINAPGAGYWHITNTILGADTDYRKQIATAGTGDSYFPGTTFERISHGGSWTSWKKVTFSDSPEFTGTPTAPTAVSGTNSTQIATTAFVASVDANTVHKTGNETIAGQKLFTDSLKVKASEGSDSARGIELSPEAWIRMSKLDGSIAVKLKIDNVTNSGIVLQAPDNSGTLALFEDVTLQTATNNGGNTTTNQIIVESPTLAAEFLGKTAGIRSLSEDGIAGWFENYSGVGNINPVIHVEATDSINALEIQANDNNGIYINAFGDGLTIDSTGPSNALNANASEGLAGYFSSTNGNGIEVQSTNSIAGKFYSANGVGVFTESTNATGLEAWSNNTAVYGESTGYPPNPNSIGGYFVSDGIALKAYSSNGTTSRLEIDNHTYNLIEAYNTADSQMKFTLDANGNTTANSFVKSGGTSTEYLMADGSVSTGIISTPQVIEIRSNIINSPFIGGGTKYEIVPTSKEILITYIEDPYKLDLVLPPVAANIGTKIYIVTSMDNDTMVLHAATGETNTIFYNSNYETNVDVGQPVSLIIISDGTKWMVISSN